MSGPTRSPLLTAEWRDLVMLNYEIDPVVLRPLVPVGVELDAWRGQTFFSLVAFRFVDTRLWGRRFPFHHTFEEVNLRFYVRREAPDGLRRGVVFVREIVPRRAISLAARWLYNEPYVTRSTAHRMARDADGGARFEYSWREPRGTNTISSCVAGNPRSPEAGSEAEFITEHYWGYTRQRDGSTREYQVQHAPWRIWTAVSAAFEGDATSLYGQEFAAALRSRPSSAFVAEGSPVSVYPGVRL